MAKDTELGTGLLERARKLLDGRKRDLDKRIDDASKGKDTPKKKGSK